MISKAVYVQKQPYSGLCMLANMARFSGVKIYFFVFYMMLGWGMRAENLDVLHESLDNTFNIAEHMLNSDGATE